MTSKIKVVAISGGLKNPSRTHALTNALTSALSKHAQIDVRLIDLGEIGPRFAGVVQPDDLPADIRAAIRAIEGADFIVAATPVYRASFTGLFKHLLDFVDHNALIDVPVLLAATGGSDRHALIIDHQLRPLFSFFQSLTLPIGVYASEADFDNYRVSSAALKERIELAVERAVPFLRARVSAELDQQVRVAA